VGGTRRRASAGVTAAQALEVQRRKHHELESRKLGIPGFETAGETVKKPALHVAITRYLEQIDALKKPSTHRKYEAVLNRFRIDGVRAKRILAAYDPDLGDRSCTPDLESHALAHKEHSAGPVIV